LLIGQTVAEIIIVEMWRFFISDRHLRFSKIRNFNCRGSTCVNVPNFMPISQTVSEIWRLYIFS